MQKQNARIYRVVDIIRNKKRKLSNTRLSSEKTKGKLVDRIEENLKR